MTFTSDRRFTQSVNLFDSVSVAIKAFKQLSTNDQLGVLWVVYENMGGPITPAATGSARLQFAQGLLTQVKNLSHDEQFQFMCDLVDQRNTPMTRAYGVLTNNTKLAFWFQLAEMMKEGTVIGVPENYQFSSSVREMYSRIAALDFGQQISLLRQAVVTMGYDPLA